MSVYNQFVTDLVYSNLFWNHKQKNTTDSSSIIVIWKLIIEQYGLINGNRVAINFTRFATDFILNERIRLLNIGGKHETLIETDKRIIYIDSITETIEVMIDYRHVALTESDEEYEIQLVRLVVKYDIKTDVSSHEWSILYNVTQDKDEVLLTDIINNCIAFE